MRRRLPKPELPYRSQLIRQLILLFITFITLFPIIWIVSLSIDPSGVARPTELRLIPAGASLAAYQKVMAQPTNNPITFGQLAFNSFKLAIGVALFSVLIGVSAAYVFSRFKIRGQKFLMLAVLTVLMMPSIGSIAPLFVLLNKVKIGLGPADTLRNSLYGVGLAIISGGLPFAIWNLKGYLDTIPRDLEEAARIDGATYQPDLLPHHPAAGDTGAGSDRVPGLPERLDRIRAVVAVPQQGRELHPVDGLVEHDRPILGPGAVVQLRGDGVAGGDAGLRGLPDAAEVHRQRSDDRQREVTRNPGTATT